MPSTMRYTIFTKHLFSIKHLCLPLLGFLITLMLLSACQQIATKGLSTKTLSAKELSTQKPAVKQPNPKQNTKTGHRTKDSLVRDNKIENAIRKFIRADQKLKASSIQIAVYNQIVLLIGQVADKTQKRKLSAFLGKIQKTFGIKTFHNKLNIGPSRTLLNISSDWLTATQVHARFLTEDINANRIRLILNNSNAYLMGIVTRAEAKQVVQLIQEMGRVKRIVLALEYVD